MSTSANSTTGTGRVPRVYIETRLDGSGVALRGKQAHYLRHVLRLKVGYSVVIFDGRGNEYVAQIEALTRDRAELRITATNTPIPEPGFDLTLLQGMVKAEAMDLIVQKATELGVRSIVPVVTEFSVVKLDAERRQRRLAHWQRIAHSACEQSGRHCPPRIADPQPLEHCLAALPQAGTRLALDPSAERAFAEEPDTRDHSTPLCLLIGPEGGLSNGDLLLADKAGFERAKFGPRVLRAETAAIAVCALAQAYWGDLLEA